jgi:hypothetical protein
MYRSHDELDFDLSDKQAAWQSWDGRGSKPEPVDDLINRFVPPGIAGVSWFLPEGRQ